METIFATQRYSGTPLFSLYDWTGAGIWQDIPGVTTTWSDVGGATSIWSDL